MKNILVTGPSAFLGYHVIKLLNKKGFRPKALVEPGLDQESDAVKELKKLDVEILQGNILDKASLLNACAGVDTVLHLRFAISLGGDAQSVKEMHDINIVGTRNMLDAVTESGVARAVVSSSSLAVGLNRIAEPLNESAEWEEHAFHLEYAQSRRTAEQQAMARPGGENLPTISIVNPSFTLGPDDYSGAPANLLVQRMAKGLPITAPIGFGILDVRDYADGVLLAAEQGQHGRRYILSGENIDATILQHKVASVLGKNPPRFLIPIPRWLACIVLALARFAAFAKGSPTRISWNVLELWNHYAWYDTSLAQSELGWKPRPFEESLRDVLVTKAAH